MPKEFILAETYSGLTLGRPKLSQLRYWVRDKEVETVIVYSLDHLSRDPVPFIILQEELEKAGVELILVTETANSSDLGKSSVSFMERVMGFEPTTSCLGSKHSSAELHPPKSYLF